MKKSVLAALIIGGFSIVGAGCGFSTGGASTDVSVIKNTPTPTPKEEKTTPTATPTPTPTQTFESTPSGKKVEVKNGIYYAKDDLNLREDCDPNAKLIETIPVGTKLDSTGVCENGWLRVNYNGKTGYVSNEFVQTNPLDQAQIDQIKQANQQGNN